MKHLYFSLFFTVFFFASCENKSNIAAIFTEEALFTNGVGGYACYRIPAIVSNKKGVLFAFAEGRVNNCGDYGNVDILLRISTDNGSHWSPAQKIIDKDQFQAGNSAPVFDFTDPRYPEGRLFLFFNTGNANEYDIRSGIGERKVWYTTSPNMGLDWNAPIEISSQVHFSKQNAILNKDWRAHANTPGHGIQLTKGKYKGRLYIAANHSTGEFKSDASDYQTYGFYSDNHGETWEVSPDINWPSSNEAIATELPNGKLMLNIREQNGQSRRRIVALSDQGGEIWNEVYIDSALVSPVCQSSIISYSNNKETALLFSGPNSTEKRQKMSIFLSRDNGKTWPVVKEVYTGASAYSDLTILDNNQVGLLYERDENGIYFAHFNETWLLEKDLVKTPPLPSKRQMDWQKMEFYAFIHFNMNTFTDQEWGYGDTAASVFNPKELDTDQWVKTIKSVGMKGVIITAKHHDGFCLWPSKYTEYSVKNSPWKNGKGDLIKELADSCEKYGLKLGIYLSPWDRNHLSYGQEEYLEYFRNQLGELLTNYGPIFEVWFDGANGGDGYYGGAKDIRKVDKKTYYEWDKTTSIVRTLQPKAVIFSDAGPDIRWVGNETGQAKLTSWAPIFKDSLYPGMVDFNKFSSGQENGTHWIPTETDVSIRPGWYYHEDQDSLVKSPKKLREIYFESIGRNSSLLLNIPVDRRGKIHQNDSLALVGLSKLIKADFKENIAANATFINQDPYTQEILLPTPKYINIISLQEDISLGQKVSSFEVMANTAQGWKIISKGTTIGNKRLLRFKSMKSAHIKIRILDAKNNPSLLKSKLFYSENEVQSNSY